MFVRVNPDRIDTPASVPDASQVSFCSARVGRFDAIEVVTDPPVYALFDVEQVLGWLGWLADHADHVTAAFEGDPATKVTERFVYRTARDEVTVPCATDWRREDLSLSLPERFDGAQFLDETGRPVPTRAETDAGELGRVVGAADLASDGNDHRLALGADDGTRYAATGRGGEEVTGSLDGTVTGPTVEAVYGRGFARVVTSLEGAVELQTGPGQSLAIVKDREEFTLRFVVTVK
ncbi:hypothetical protein ACKVMT_11165 [Halobacteriales archaeon Cl-PHB]